MNRIAHFYGTVLLAATLPLQLWATALSQRLVSPDPQIRQSAEEEFNRLSPEGREQLIPDFTVDLEDEDPGVRNQARKLLHRIGSSNATPDTNAQRELSPLPSAASSPTERQLRLKEAHEDEKQSFPDLKQEMNDVKGTQAISADTVKTEGQGLSLSSALIDSLKDPDPWVRSRAARRISQMHPAPLEAIPGLITLLKDRNAEVRASAAGALGGIGPAARQAVPTLLHTLADPDPAVREIAGDALKQIQPSAHSE